MVGCLTEDRNCYSAVADPHKRAGLPRLDHTAAIAATAILLAAAPMGCDDTEAPDTSAAYGVPADVSQDADDDVTAQPAYGVLAALREDRSRPATFGCVNLAAEHPVESFCCCI